MKIYQTRVLTAAAIFNESDWMMKKTQQGLEGRLDLLTMCIFKKKERKRRIKKTRKISFKAKLGIKCHWHLRLAFQGAAEVSLKDEDRVLWWPRCQATETASPGDLKISFSSPEHSSVKRCTSYQAVYGVQTKTIQSALGSMVKFQP